MNCSGAHKGWEKVTFYPSLSDPGGPFSAQTAKCCRLPLSTLCENKEITNSGGPMPIVQAPFEASESPFQAREGVFKALDGLFKNKVGKQRLVSGRYSLL